VNFRSRGSADLPDGRARAALPLPWLWRPLAAVLAGIAAFAVVVVIVTGASTDYLWFAAIGHSGVFAVTYGVRWAMFGIAGAFLALTTGLNAALARRLRPRDALAGPGLERYRYAVDPNWGRLLTAVLAVIGVVGGLAGASSWRTWLQFANRTSFGVRDPQFHLDISFFVYVYPFLRLLLGFLFAAVLLALFAAAAVHYLYGGLRFRPGDSQATAAARVHLFVLFGLFVLLKAASYWLDRYGIDLDSHSVVATGASYADVNAILPAKTVLAAIAVLCALLFFAGAARRNVMLPAVGFCLLVLSAILIGGVYPAVIEQFVVKPNELAKESRYIQREIDGTRAAYGIGGATVSTYPVAATGTSGPGGSGRRLEAEVAALPDLRLMDPDVVSRTFQQLQQVKSFYRFAGALDVDRYRVPGGGSTPEDMVVGVRDMAGPPAGRASWVNTHLVYTHGFGVVAAPAGSAQADGDPSFAEGNIPPAGVLGQYQPRVYFGPRQDTYAIAGAPRGSTPMEFDYPTLNAAQQRNTTYSGGGGVPIGSMATRLLYAIKFADPNILLSSAVNRDSRLLYVRDPLARVAKVAPFLTLDGDVYPVVADGQILWVADGYTTTDDYPYSARYDATEASDGSPGPRGPGSGQINYIRDSVKAVVNAYTGRVTLYQWDAADPLLRTWMKAFPGLIRPRSAIPAGLLAHLRYPQDLFDVQREALASYHVRSATAFYGGQDSWAVPGDPTATEPDVDPQPPAYLTMTMPGYRRPEFSLTTSFTQQGRPDMAGYMAVDSDPDSPDYGTIRLLSLEQDAAAPGPQQVQNTFESDPGAAAELTLLRRGGSRVILGDLIALPVGAGFLYVEPVYVADAQGDSGSYPTMQGVLASYGGSVGYGRTARDALDQVFAGLAGAVQPHRGGGTAKAPEGGAAATGTGGTSAAVRSDIARAERWYTAAQAALADSDFTAYGRDLTAMKKALDAARRTAGT